MSDKLGAYDSIKGVFADLDDGGLTDDEALDQIRDLVGAEKPLPKVVVFTYLVPVELVVNLETESVQSAEMNSGDIWGPLPNQTVIDQSTMSDVDADLQDKVIEKVKAIADDGGWQYDITTQ